MDRNRIESLTKRERDCLRLVSFENGTGDIASELDLTVTTVNTYIKRAREKLGAGSRFAAARALRDYEARHPSEGPPERGLVEPPPTDHRVLRDTDERAAAPDMVHDMARSAGWPDLHADRRSSVRDVEVRNALTPVRRLAMIATLVILIAFAILLAFPLSESFQRLANVIDPVNP